MTTLEQQIAHFRDYWKVPQEDIDKLIKLVIANYLESLNKVAKISEDNLIDILEKDYEKYCN